MVVKPTVVVLSGSLPSTSNTCNGTCFSAGVINQPTNRELLSKTEKIYGSGRNVRRDVSCNHGANICMDSFLLIVKSVLLLLPSSM